VHPVRSIAWRNMRYTLATIAGLWLLIVLSNLCHISKYGIHEYQYVVERRRSCVLLSLADGTVRLREGRERAASEALRAKATTGTVRAYYFTFSAMAFVLPLALVCLLYVAMLSSLWRRNSLLRLRPAVKQSTARRSSAGPSSSAASRAPAPPRRSSLMDGRRSRIKVAAQLSASRPLHCRRVR